MPLGISPLRLPLVVLAREPLRLWRGDNTRLYPSDRALFRHER